MKRELYALDYTDPGVPAVYRLHVEREEPCTCPACLERAGCLTVVSYWVDRAAAHGYGLHAIHDDPRSPLPTEIEIEIRPGVVLSFRDLGAFVDSVRRLTVGPLGLQ